jgi:kynurenine 3-monooxygenase
MRSAGRDDLIESVMRETIPMRGRMIHGKRSTGELYEESQDYDAHGRVSCAMDIGNLLSLTVSRRYLPSIVADSIRDFSTS